MRADQDGGYWGFCRGRRVRRDFMRGEGGSVWRGLGSIWGGGWRVRGWVWGLSSRVLCEVAERVN